MWSCFATLSAIDGICLMMHNTNVVMGTVCAVAMLLAACREGPAEPSDVVRDQDALFQTDSLQYAIADNGSLLTVDIGVTFTNSTGAPVYIVNCNGATGFVLERRNGSRWDTMYSPVLPACLSPPIVVEAGASRRDVVRVLAGYPGSNVRPQFSTRDLSGEYRVVWTAFLRSYDPRNGSGTPLPASSATSNRFVLVAPR